MLKSKFCPTFTLFIYLSLNKLIRQSVTALEIQRKATIFQSVLITFEATIIFQSAGAVANVGLSLRLNRHNQL